MPKRTQHKCPQCGAPTTGHGKKALLCEKLDCLGVHLVTDDGVISPADDEQWKAAMHDPENRNALRIAVAERALRSRMVRASL